MSCLCEVLRKIVVVVVVSFTLKHTCLQVRHRVKLPPNYIWWIFQIFENLSFG